MVELKLKESDLDFVVETAAPEFEDKEKLKQLIREDQDFRKHLIGNEKLLKKVMTDEEIEIKISLNLFFEILLRNALRELVKTSHTFERIGSQRVPVFDSKNVVESLNEAVLIYLTEMLLSFTKIESFTLPVRVRKGVWRKIRFNDMDIDSLSRFCQAMDEEHRFGFYKRIADVCLFIMGVFPEYIQWDYRYSSGEIRPKIPGTTHLRWVPRRSAEEYEEEGRKFYQLAAEHPTAKVVKLEEVFWQLHEKFNLAKKPLDFISQQYLHFKKQKLFDIES
jgi:hypothetical protein